MVTSLNREYKKKLSPILKDYIPVEKNPLVYNAIIESKHTKDYLIALYTLLGKKKGKHIFDATKDIFTEVKEI